MGNHPSMFLLRKTQGKKNIPYDKLEEGKWLGDSAPLFQNYLSKFSLIIVTI